MAPQPTLMFVPSGSSPIAATSAPSCAERLRRDAAVGAVRAVHDDAQPRPGRCRSGRGGARGSCRSRSRRDRRRRAARPAARRAAPRSPPRSRRRACCPLASKNLTPLYSGGLCEAEMTQPRSSASSATAGVGRTPPSTACPPAETTPRAKASSSSGPDPRVSRPMKMRPSPRPQRRRAAEALDEIDASDPRRRPPGRRRCRSTAEPRRRNLPVPPRQCIVAANGTVAGIPVFAGGDADG